MQKLMKLQTEVSMAVIQLYLEKSPAERTEKHLTLAREGMKLVETCQDQLCDRDKALYQQALTLL